MQGAVWSTMLRQVALLLFLAGCTSSDVPTTEKTVQQGATVNEPVLKVSALDKHDHQLMVYHRGELSAQYFCNNGICNSQPESVCQFQVSSGYLCLIIPNVNVSNSGTYTVVHNGLEDVLNLMLIVEEVPQQSILTWLLPVIVVFILAAVLILAIRLKYKKLFGFQRTETTPI